MIVQSRIYVILELECPEVFHSALKKCRSQFEAHIHGLKSLNINVTDAVYLYVTILQMKLAPIVLDNIACSLPPEDIWSVDQLRGGIEQKFEHLRRAEEVSVYTPTSGTTRRSAKASFLPLLIKGKGS